jgi:uncharacterized protein (TIGR02271 family)
MAQQTVIGIFDSAEDAQRTVSELTAAGFSREHVDVASRSSMAGGNGSGTDSDHYNASGTMVEGAADRVGRAFEGSGSTGSSTDRNPDWNDRNASGTAVEGAADYAGRKVEEGGSAIGRFFRNLFGDDDDSYSRYSAAAERSNSIVTVHASSDEHAERAAEIMDRCGAVDVDEPAGQNGTSGAYGNTGSTRQNMVGEGRTADAQQRVQVIQEDLQVGKREVATGGARLRSRVVSRPVEENLRLREEHVFVNREPVNRPATDADFGAFREGTIELTERAEVPVVQKEARVVEEVSLGKQVEERTETIRDSVRSTEVEVERIEGDERRTGSSGNTPL